MTPTELGEGIQDRVVGAAGRCRSRKVKGEEKILEGDFDRGRQKLGKQSCESQVVNVSNQSNLMSWTMRKLMDVFSLKCKFNIK